MMDFFYEIEEKNPRSPKFNTRVAMNGFEEFLKSKQ